MKAGRVVEWILRILIAGIFLVAGIDKFGPRPLWVRMFNDIGFGQWFRYFTGSVEVAGAILLLVPRTTPIAAFLIGCTMIGIVIAHVALHHLGPPTLVIGLLFCGLIWVYRRARTF
jgi:putative oxidoreductase